MAPKIQRFLRDKDGSASVELALWMPFFWLVFGLIVDGTMLFKYQTQFVDVAREASRQVSIDKMDQMEAYNYVVAQFPNIDNLAVDIFVDGETVTTTVDAPIRSLTMFADFMTGSARVNGHISMFLEEAITPPAGAANDVTGV